MKSKFQVRHEALAKIIVLSMCLQAFAMPTHAQTDQLSAEEKATLYPETTRYTIRRKGKKVGEHTVTFNQDKNGLSVDVESKITVTVL